VSRQENVRRAEVGEDVWKVFPDQPSGSSFSGGPCRGRVEAVSDEEGQILWHVKYEDGDREDWDRADVAKYARYLMPFGGEEGTDGDQRRDREQGQGQKRQASKRQRR
jgi:hypothetical protein